MLFEDEERAEAEAERESVVTPAPRSESAKAKESTKRNAEGWPLHSFQTLLDDMGTLCLNQVRAGDDECSGTFVVKTQPTEYQSRVFELAGITV